jgi:hypothetical protein
MMNSAKMMWGCGAVAGVVVILAVAGLGFAALFAIPCIAMMGGMAWMMVRMGSGSSRDTKRK